MSIVARAASLAGLDPSAVGEDNMRRAAALAMERLHLSQDAYLARLASDPAERRALAGAAVVQETWLFRDRQSFESLGRLAGTLSRPLRVLSAPCATGEEAASIAATLLDAGLAPEDFVVDAADASPLALAKARIGRFGPASMRGGIPPNNCLQQEGEDLTLSPEALGRIRFLEADILDEGFLAGEPPYQAVFCNNLLIYLSVEARIRLAANLTRLIAPQGALFTSPAEAPAMAALGLVPFDSYSGCAISYPMTQADTVQKSLVPPCPPESLFASSTRPADSHRGSDASPSANAVLLGRAKELADAGRLPQAMELVESVLDGEEPDAAAYHLKGVIHLAQGEQDLAEQALRRALYLDPGHVETLGHLELLARAGGRDAEAGLLAERSRRAGLPGLAGEGRS